MVVLHEKKLKNIDKMTRTTSLHIREWSTWRPLLLCIPQTVVTVHVDWLREDDFVSIAVSGASRPTEGRRRSRGNVGDRGESRIVRRSRMHSHFVADRQGRVRSALKRVRPTEISRAVLGRGLLQLQSRKIWN